LIKILNLINGKLRVQAKLDQIYKNIIPYVQETIEYPLIITINTLNDLNNYWLAGFTDGQHSCLYNNKRGKDESSLKIHDGSFQIKILNRKN